MTGRPSQLTWRWLTSDTSRNMTKRYKQEEAAIDHAGWAMQSSKCRCINKGRLLVFSSRAALAGPRAQPIKCRASDLAEAKARQYIEKVHQGCEYNDTTWHNSGRIMTALRLCCSLLQLLQVNSHLTGNECAVRMAGESTEILRHSNDTEILKP
jgi:hypothetical protein